MRKILLFVTLFASGQFGESVADHRCSWRHGFGSCSVFSGCVAKAGFALDIQGSALGIFGNIRRLSCRGIICSECAIGVSDFYARGDILKTLKWRLG